MRCPWRIGIRFYETVYTPVLDRAGAVVRVFSVGRAIANPRPWFDFPKAGTPLPNGTQAGKHIAHIEQQTLEVSRSAALLQLVLDNIPQCIFWKDKNLVYLGCNRKWAEMAGVGEPENVTGLTDYDLPWTEAEANFTGSAIAELWRRAFLRCGCWSRGGRQTENRPGARRARFPFAMQQAKSSAS